MNVESNASSLVLGLKPTQYTHMYCQPEVNIDLILGAGSSHFCGPTKILFWLRAFEDKDAPGSVCIRVSKNLNEQSNELQTLTYSIWSFKK